MKQFVYGILSILVACFYSCDDEHAGAKGNKGYLFLDIENNVALQTRAYEINLNVLILDEAEDTVKFIPGYDSTAMKEDILLDAGAYQVVITSGQADSAVWETPYFYGKEEFQIVANEVSVVKVVCKIANTKVTVDYTNQFKEYFPDYSTTVSNSSGSLRYEKGETRGGFFAAEKLTALLNLVNKDGQKFELKRVFPDIKERCHYNLKFSLGEDVPDKEGVAGGNFDITVDETADTVFVRIPIEVEDLDNLKVPEFSLEGFDKNYTLSMKAGVGAPNSLTLKVKAGIETFTMSVRSKQLNEQGLYDFDFVKLTADDRAKLETMEFPLPDVSATELTLDLSAMSGKLLSDEDAIQKHQFTFCVMDKKHQEQTITLTYEAKPNRDVITADVESLWATFAVLKGSTEYENGLGFQYKELSAEDWNEVSFDSIKKGEAFSSLIVGLKPCTAYLYRAVGVSPAGVTVYGNEVQFTTGFVNSDTSGKPFIPNLGFDDWTTYSDGKSAMANLEGEPVFWDSGNRGANTIGTKNPTSKTTIAHGGQYAAKLASVYVGFKPAGSLGQFAAASLFTGNFVDVSGMGGILNFGQKVSVNLRPTKLTGYYHYTTGPMDYKGNSNLSVGQPDTCSIYIALLDKSAPYQINTNKPETFIDFSENNKEIIAYGKFETGTTTSNSIKSKDDYVQFNIDIKYRDLTRIPQYILIVSSASKYGDYFAGSESSVLYIDDYELGFDYNENSFIGTFLEELTPANTNK